MAERRLAAIMFTDIVGYTALMAKSEEKALRARERHRALVRPLVQRYRGEAIEVRGDESLSVFPSVLDAVNCGLAMQAEIEREPELALHIGIHLGDIVLRRGEVSGDGVNIASRICALSDGATLYVSEEVHQAVRNQPNFEATPVGEHQLKNVGRPVHVFRVHGEAGAPSPEPTSTAAPARGPIQSLAVLPLEDLSGDPSQEYFADGMTEALIGDLAQIGSLRVISRTSIMQYKGARRPLPEIARELNVEGIIEGTVLRAGERVRITAQLIRASTDEHIWAERYDRDLTDVLALQSEVAEAVAREVEASLTPQERVRLAHVPVISPEAHDAYLKGRERLEAGKSRRKASAAPSSTSSRRSRWTRATRGHTRHWASVISTWVSRWAPYRTGGPCRRHGRRHCALSNWTTTWPKPTESSQQSNSTTSGTIREPSGRACARSPSTQAAASFSPSSLRPRGATKRRWCTACARQSRIRSLLA